jgi:hypothetical protein
MLIDDDDWLIAAGLRASICIVLQRTPETEMPSSEKLLWRDKA